MKPLILSAEIVQAKVKNYFLKKQRITHDKRKENTIPEDDYLLLYFTRNYFVLKTGSVMLNTMRPNVYNIRSTKVFLFNKHNIKHLLLYQNTHYLCNSVQHLNLMVKMLDFDFLVRSNSSHPIRLTFGLILLEKV